MSQLHLIQDGKITQTYPINKSEILLGRGEQSDIQLDFSGISRKHLRLMTVMDDSFLEDLASKNGTYVNGRLSKKCPLNDGDVIQLGEVELVFDQLSEGAPEQVADPDATQVLTPGNFGPNTLAAKAAGTKNEGISPVAYAAAQAQQAESADSDTQPTPQKQSLWQRLLGIFR